MEPIKLTANQINEFDEINHDLIAADATLRIAMGFHANRMNELQRAQKEFWQKLSEAHGVDYLSSPHTVRRHEGAVCVVELTPEEHAAALKKMGLLPNG